MFMENFDRKIVSILPAALMALSAESANVDKPNILLIYVDDLGYSDLSCFGNEYGNKYPITPNIDSLALSGVRFTSAYSAAPISTAARAGLLTGLYPARLGMEFVTTNESKIFSWHSEKWESRFSDKKLIPPPITPALSLEYPTVAEILAENGYETGIVGKWHLAPHNGRYLGWDENFGPSARGFEWAVETFGSHTYSKKKENKNSPAYPEDELTEKAKEFISQPHDRPFFLFISHYYVHTPVAVKSEAILSKYRTRFPDLSEEKIQYLAFIDRMDHYVGDLLDVLKEKKLTENTIVIFASDNGGHPQYSANLPFRGSKWNLYEGGIRTPMIIAWNGHIEQNVTDEVVCQTDIFPTILEIAGIHSDDIDFDGESFARELLTGKFNKKRSKSLIWHFPYYHPEGDAYFDEIDSIGVNDGAISKTRPHSALRIRNYKLLYFYEDESCELYHITKDPYEQNDLSQVKKSTTRKMRKTLLEELNGMSARLPRKW